MITNEELKMKICMQCRSKRLSAKDYDYLRDKAWCEDCKEHVSYCNYSRSAKEDFTSFIEHKGNVNERAYDAWFDWCWNTACNLGLEPEKHGIFEVIEEYLKTHK